MFLQEPKGPSECQVQGLQDALQCSEMDTRGHETHRPGLRKVLQKGQPWGWLHKRSGSTGAPRGLVGVGGMCVMVVGVCVSQKRWGRGQDQ